MGELLRRGLAGAGRQRGGDRGGRDRVEFGPISSRSTGTAGAERGPEPDGREARVRACRTRAGESSNPGSPCTSR